MFHHARKSLLAALAVGAVFACGAPERQTAPLISPESKPTPNFGRINATDSLLMLTNILYSDTAVILQRTTPLAADISTSATIGRAGGQLSIPQAGITITFPSGALTQSTTITMTALKGTHVAYDFQPHGIVFLQPVKITQDLTGTGASGIAALLNGMHGAYFDASLDLSQVDPTTQKGKVQETELGYFENNRARIKFYVGHFSGYLLSCGRGDAQQ